MENKRIIVLEDLGISKKAVEALASEYKIDHSFEWESVESISEPKNIVGIITIKKPIESKLIELFSNITFVAVAFTQIHHTIIKFLQKTKDDY